MRADWHIREALAGVDATRVWSGLRLPLWVVVVLPLVLMGLLLSALALFGPLGALDRGVPPVEALTIERIDVRADPSRLVVNVVNGGPAEVTIAQTLVDDAYWTHTVEPDRTLPRLGRAAITIPYPWVAGEPHEIKLLTATGLVFTGEVPVAVESPMPDSRSLVALTMVGVYVGAIPVALGLLWYPFLRRMDRRWLHFFLMLTAGLLVFLATDALAEAIAMAGNVPSAYHGTSLVVVGLIGTLAALQLTAGARGRLERDDMAGRRALAIFVALSIGLHNLGEGMAVGAAYSVGEMALGAFLIVGFALHNMTEGLGIAAPVAHDRVGFPFLAGLGLLAGAPTIVGAWLGGLAYLPVLAALFFAVGAGAALQVVFEIGALLQRRGAGELSRPTNVIGFALGVAAMYATALVVAA